MIPSHLQVISRQRETVGKGTEWGGFDGHEMFVALFCPDSSPFWPLLRLYRVTLDGLAAVYMFVFIVFVLFSLQLWQFSLKHTFLRCWLHPDARACCAQGSTILVVEPSSDDLV
jgi:hypothetical protein